MQPKIESSLQPRELPVSRIAEIRKVAQELEATFLAEMLKASGVGKPLESFGGGEGEVAFSSLLTVEYATRISERGGIGLAEVIFRSLVEKEG